MFLSPKTQRMHMHAQHYSSYFLPFLHYKQKAQDPKSIFNEDFFPSA